MGKELVCISFSGGRTSAMMTKYLLDMKSDIYDFVVVFANTGHEREATLQFVKKCDDIFGFNTVWIEAVTNNKFGYGVSYKIVNYETAYRNYLKNGVDPFESYIAKHGIPNQNFPSCSRELKKNTIRAYMKNALGFNKITYKTALGIRSDEPKRLDWIKAKRDKLMYFAELGKITKSAVNEFWSKQQFDLELKSYQGNCILCWKKSDRKLYTIIQEGILSNDKELLAEMEWIKYIENTYGKYYPNKRSLKHDINKQINFFRKDRNMEEIIQESYLFDVSEFAKDESKLIDTAKQLSIWDDELDGNFGCTESCEAF